MGSTPVAYIDETGCHVPAPADELAFFQAAFRRIYGADTNLDNATQDGQWLGILAAMLHDVNSGILATWNAYSPGEAVGVGLDKLLKLVDLARAVPSRSSVPMTLVGQDGTPIIAGSLIDDEAGFSWAVPACVIPAAGQIVVTALCTTEGAITAPAGTVTKIRAPDLGWQAAFNAAAATPGAPVERDGPFRRRATVSSAIPARGLTEATSGALLALPGVIDVAAYENDEDVSDARGLPPHSVAFVVTGGDDAAIAEMIRRKKGGGATLYGTTTVLAYDRAGIPKPIKFFRPVDVQISAYITIEALQGFTIDVQNAIAAAVAAWAMAQGNGIDLIRLRAIVPATFGGAFPSNTYKVKDIQLARDGQGPAQTDIAMQFYERPVCVPANVQFIFPNRTA